MVRLHGASSRAGMPALDMAPLEREGGESSMPLWFELADFREATRLRLLMGDRTVNAATHPLAERAASNGGTGAC